MAKKKKQGLIVQKDGGNKKKSSREKRKETRLEIQDAGDHIVNNPGALKKREQYHDGDTSSEEEDEKEGSETKTLDPRGGAGHKISRTKKTEAVKVNVERSQPVLLADADADSAKKMETNDIFKKYNEKPLFSCSLEESEEYLNGELQMFAWMIAPMTVEEFFETYWERRPFVIKRGGKNLKENYYANLFTREHLEEELEKSTGSLKYGREITLAHFDADVDMKIIDNVKEDGEAAEVDEVKNSLDKGSSCQCMHPQRFSENVWSLLADLEKTFGCLYGSNSYITPNEHTGFAPHYDDVEVFMLQTEGRKRWQCWTEHGGVKGRDFSDLKHPNSLPREYSRDFKVDECRNDMTKRLDVILEPGDLLYIPRGTVHQGEAVPESSDDCKFSHHLTVSTYQKTSYLDFLEQLLPAALLKANKQDWRYRKGLPIRWQEQVGCLTKEDDDVEMGPDDIKELVRKNVPDSTFLKSSATREEFAANVRQLVKDVVNACDDKLMNDVADQMGSDFMIARLPPHRTANRGDNPPELQDKKNTYVRFLDRSNVRCALDVDPETGESQCLLFYPHRNPRELHMSGEGVIAKYLGLDSQPDMEIEEPDEDPKGSVRLEEMFFPAVRAFFKAEPGTWINMMDLPLEMACDKAALCQLLYELHLIQVKEE